MRGLVLPTPEPQQAMNDGEKLDQSPLVLRPFREPLKPANRGTMQLPRLGKIASTYIACGKQGNRTYYSQNGLDFDIARQKVAVRHKLEVR
jgi:hypothetical protein